MIVHIVNARWFISEDELVHAPIFVLFEQLLLHLFANEFESGHVLIVDFLKLRIVFVHLVRIVSAFRTQVIVLEGCLV